MMAELGVEIDLLTYGEGQDVDIPGVRIVRIPRFKVFGSVRVGPSYLKLLLDFFVFLWTVRLLLTKRYTFVHAHEESVFFCRFLKRLFRFKLVYDMHSSLPQQVVNFRFTKSRLLYGLFARWERSCLRAADAVITICPELADYATSIMPDSSRHFLIENSVFEKVCLLDEGEHGENEQGRISIPSDKRLVVYAGTFEPYQGLELLLQGFAEVKDKLPEALLLMVGGTMTQVETLRRLSESLGLNGDCIFCGRVPPNQARQYVRSAEVVISPRIHGTNTPLKIYEELAHGSVLVATKIRSHTQILNDNVCILVDPEPNSIGQGIITAMKDRKRRDEISQAAKRLYERKYSRSHYKNKMRQLLECLDRE